MNNNIQNVVNKYLKYLPKIDFSVRGTDKERVAEQSRVIKLIQPSLKRTLKMIFDIEPGPSR